MGNKCPKTTFESRSWNVGDVECEECDDWHVVNGSEVDLSISLQPPS